MDALTDLTIQRNNLLQATLPQVLAILQESNPKHAKIMLMWIYGHTTAQIAKVVDSNPDSIRHVICDHRDIINQLGQCRDAVISAMCESGLYSLVDTLHKWIVDLAARKTVTVQEASVASNLMVRFKDLGAWLASPERKAPKNLGHASRPLSQSLAQITGNTPMGSVSHADTPAPIMSTPTSST